MAAARPRLDPCSPQNAAARPVLTRRSAVGRGMAATLAASRLLAPSLFVGCSLGIPPRSPTAIIGLLHSQTGPLAIGSSSVRDVELFAIERINAGGGLLGHQLEAKAPDTRSRTELFAKRATQLLDNGALALFGCWTSSGRKAVLPVVEERDSLLFYPVQYEGNESSRNIVYGNSLPNQHVLPAIDWLMGETGGSRRKFFLLGSDYLYPRTTNFIVKKYLSSKDITPLSTMTIFVPSCSRSWRAVPIAFSTPSTARATSPCWRRCLPRRSTRPTSQCSRRASPRTICGLFSRRMQWDSSPSRPISKVSTPRSTGSG